MRVRIEFECGWSPEKVRGISAQLQRDLRMYGGVHGISPLTIVGEEEIKAPEKLKFYCNCNPGGKGICQQIWESETFTPCPIHGRKWVHKGERPATPEVAASN